MTHKEAFELVDNQLLMQRDHAAREAWQTLKSEVLSQPDVQQLKAEIAALVVKVDAIPQRELPLMVGEFIERMRQLSAV